MFRHQKLAQDIVAVEQQLRALKRVVRSTPQPRVAQRELIHKKAEATVLYAIVAHRRGRLHLRKLIHSHAPLGLPPLVAFTLEDQARLIVDRAQAYQEEAA